MKLETMLRFLLLLILLCLIVGCGAFQTSIPVQPLQSGLASKDDFQGGWTWPTDQQGISGPEIVVLAGQKVEKATIYFLGKSRITGDGFLLQHFLYRYQEQLSTNYTDTFSLGSFEPGSTDLLFDIQTMGAVSQSKCVIAVTKLLYCSIRAKYRYVESQLNILGYWKGSQQDFETLVNQTITKLNTKVKAIDEPYSAISPVQTTLAP